VRLPLNLVRDQPLQRQLYDQLRDLIASGRLAPGSRMPSTRMLAEQSAISRITVVLTYERLIAEGHLETMPAKGTFVSRPSLHQRTGLAERQAPFAPPVRQPRTGTEAGVGHADPSLFPAVRWRTLIRGALDRIVRQLGAELPDGSPALRGGIAAWLSTSRGLAVAPDQVVIVSGRQQALHVALQVALRPGARAVVEDPCDPLTAAALTRAGRRRDPRPGGRQRTAHGAPARGTGGIAVCDARASAATRRVLAGERRAALLQWAVRADALVLEEDCDGDLRYDNVHAPSLMSLARQESVCLIGGFGASLGPWVTLAYMVIPHRLISQALAARALIDDSRHWLEETALAELLNSGGYARHVHRLDKAYAGRSAALVDALRRIRAFADLGRARRSSPRVVSPGDIGPAAGVAGVARRCGLEAASSPAARGVAGEEVLIGFGSLQERQAEPRVAELAGMLRATHPAALAAAK
jgi:GntR family transcriptional regulator/MocR family aminotransferase